MDDKELLTLAARAAGYKLWWGITDPMIECHEPENPDKTHNLWNPLTDDGDALRLAVKLRLVIKWHEYEVIALHKTYEWSSEVCNPSNPCPYAATRRAIVRTAAVRGL